MDEFDKIKKQALLKKDRSKKGFVDHEIASLLNRINGNKNYFTTSSCSGRITIRIRPHSDSKRDVSFLFESHSQVGYSSLIKALGALSNQELWFRFEPAILHISCRTIENAEELLKKAIPLFKHSGIIAMSRKITLEIRGSEFIETPLAENGKILVNNEFLKKLAYESNRRLRETHIKIKKLRNLV